MTNNAYKLSPCKHCYDTRMTMDSTLVFEKPIYFARCMLCGATGPRAAKEVRAAELFNRKERPERVRS